MGPLTHVTIAGKHPMSSWVLQLWRPLNAHWRVWGSKMLFPLSAQITQTYVSTAIALQCGGNKKGEKSWCRLDPLQRSVVCPNNQNRRSWWVLCATGAKDCLAACTARFAVQQGGSVSSAQSFVCGVDVWVSQQHGFRASFTFFTLTNNNPTAHSSICCHLFGVVFRCDDNVLQWLQGYQASVQRKPRLEPIELWTQSDPREENHPFSNKSKCTCEKNKPSKQKQKKNPAKHDLKILIRQTRDPPIGWGDPLSHCMLTFTMEDVHRIQQPGGCALCK